MEFKIVSYRLERNSFIGGYIAIPNEAGIVTILFGKEYYVTNAFMQALYSLCDAYKLEPITPLTLTKMRQQLREYVDLNLDIISTFPTNTHIYCLHKEELYEYYN